eukprot:SRR837773.19888.p1 GENE.SRR837773.19888~~SRR837773.19888.p1  ORF type:complete len:610 (-),score=221.13 SRR837773.19888:119-1750(-)
MRRQGSLAQSAAAPEDAGRPGKPCGSLIEGETGRPCSNDGPEADDPFKSEEDSAMDDIVSGGESTGDADPTSRLYWLEYGCRAEQVNLLNTVAVGVDRAHYAAGDKKLGKVQCCSVMGNPECVRKGAGVCFTGFNDTDLFVTHAEALTTCEAVGMRLCTKDEVLSSGPLSCCNSGCEVNHELVWTATASDMSSVEEHSELKAELKNVVEENQRLQSSLDNYGKQLEHIEDKLKHGHVAAGRAGASHESAGGYGAITGKGLPPLPGEGGGGGGSQHAFTEEEAERLRADNARLAHEKEELDQQNRNLKDHIIDAVASTVLNNGSKVDPNTLPSTPFWPISTPAPNVSSEPSGAASASWEPWSGSWSWDRNGTNASNGTNGTAGVLHRPVLEELPNGRKVITDSPRDDFARGADAEQASEEAGTEDVLETGEQVDFSSHQVFDKEIELAFDSLDGNKDGKIEWHDIQNVLSMMKNEKRLPDTFDTSPLESDFRTSGVDNDGKLNEAGFGRFIQGLSARTGKEPTSSHELLRGRGLGPGDCGQAVR